MKLMNKIMKIPMVVINVMMVSPSNRGPARPVRGVRGGESGSRVGISERA